MRKYILVDPSGCFFRVTRGHPEARRAEGSLRSLASLGMRGRKTQKTPRPLILVVFILFLNILSAPDVFSHCQIPCGIYGDELRFDMIEEDITTIEKSIKEIVRLSKEGDKNFNQIVRWVSNKERHADHIKDIVTEYFMTQRLKPQDKDYVKKIGLLHEMLIYAMKAKQGTDLNNAEKLKLLLSDFKNIYFDKEEEAKKAEGE